MPKASVLPVPVRAWPIRSVPMRATERVISWMAKGVTMPTRSSASAISGSTPSSRKVVRILPVCRARPQSRDRRVGPGARWRPHTVFRCPTLGTAGRGRHLGRQAVPPWYRYPARVTETPGPTRDATPDPFDDQVAFSDPAYRAAVVDLLGVIAYGEMSA